MVVGYCNAEESNSVPNNTCSLNKDIRTLTHKRQEGSSSDAMVANQQVPGHLTGTLSFIGSHHLLYQPVNWSIILHAVSIAITHSQTQHKGRNVQPGEQKEQKQNKTEQKKKTF